MPESEALPVAAEQLPPSDVAWQAVVDTTIARERHRQRGALAEAEKDSRRTRAALAEKARQFYTAFPADPRAGKARKTELEAMLSADDESVSPELTQRIAAYLADRSQPAADRFDISALSKHARRTRTPPADRTDSNRRNVADARALIAEFPDDSRGYGYLLALAKGHESAQAKRLAAEIIKSGAPDEIKAGAQRLLDRVSLENNPLRLDVSGLKLDAMQGAPMVVYSWTLKEPLQLNLIRDLGKIEGVIFVGVNLDANREAAETAVRLMEIPGRQIYDGQGEEGPVARQLKLTMTSSVLLVDERGIVVDVNTHEDAEAKVRAAVEKAAKKGGRS